MDQPAPATGIAPPPPPPRFRLSPVARRRLARFKANRRGYWSLIIFTILFVLSLFAEFLANDRPILVVMKGEVYVPVLRDYAETDFGGVFPTAADYTDPVLVELIEKEGTVIWPPVRYSYDTFIADLPTAAPSPPSARNWLGTDDAGRDLVARLIYGFRISVLFGLTLTIAASAIGIAVGAIQGYFGGLVDLLGQRVLEIWAGMPQLYVLIIVAAIIAPSFWTLLVVLTLFAWPGLVPVVRAEVLRARNFDYVRAARAMGMGDYALVFRHVLPNAMVATLTFLPFILTGAITALSALDFLGFGLPPGSPSLGELLAQGKENLRAPWLGISAFLTIATMLSLLIFVGEAVRDAFDPRKAV